MNISKHKSKKKHKPIVEIFKYIYLDGEKTHFLISDYGRCYDEKHNKLIPGYIEKNSGRRVISLSFNKKHYTQYVARWIARAFIPLPYGDDYSIFQADHIDENRFNDTLTNIQWLSRDDNMKKHWKLRVDEHTGENNQFSILTEKIVRDILNDALKYNMTPMELSRKYSINRFTIQKIVKGINWSHIYKEYDMGKYNPHKGTPKIIPDDIRNMIIEEYKNGKCISHIHKQVLLLGYNVSESCTRKIIKESKL